MEHIKHVFKGKGDKYMGKIKNAFDALNVLLNCIINLTGKMKTKKRFGRIHIYTRN